MQVVVRLVGSPLITGTRYVAPGMRCDVCGKRFKTPIPKEITDAPKHDISVSTTLAIAHYSLGLPMHRIEDNQAQHGIPMPDATQYDLLSNLSDIALPIYDELGKQSANGNLFLYDDTSGRILANQSQGITTHTLPIISNTKSHSLSKKS